MASSKTWTGTLDSKTWTRTQKNLDPEKPGINIVVKNMSDCRDLCFMKTNGKIFSNDEEILREKNMVSNRPELNV